MTHRWYHRIRWARLGLLITLPLTLTLAVELAQQRGERAEDAAALIRLEFYDVSDLIGTPPSYPAPGHPDPSKGGGGGAAGGVLVFDDEPETLQIEPDRLVELVEAKLGSGIECSGGVLIVRRGQADHAKLVELLRALREV